MACEKFCDIVLSGALSVFWLATDVCVLLETKWLVVTKKGCAYISGQEARPTPRTSVEGHQSGQKAEDRSKGKASKHVLLWKDQQEQVNRLAPANLQFRGSGL